MGCIYLARCKTNGKGYVGKTVKTLEERKNGHQRGIHNGTQLFYRAIRKYGWDAFEWTILAEDDDEEWLFLMEQKWIKRLGTKMPNGYNMTDGGEGHAWEFTDEQRLKMSLAHIGKKLPEEQKEKIRLAGIGRKHSEESKKKMSEVQKGRVLSEEHRAKISASETGKIISEEIRKKISLAMTGRKFSEQHVENIRRSRTGHPFQGNQWTKRPTGQPGQSPSTPGKAPSTTQEPPEDETGVEPPTEEEAVKTASRALELAVKSLGLDVAGAGLPAVVADKIIAVAGGR